MENNKLSTTDDYRHRINMIIAYIDTHIEDTIHLKDLAEIANFSPYHFHRITRAFLGEPICAYISRMRVEAAAKFLCFSDLSVSEIANRVGFEMPSSLTKAFSKVYGISPSKYRAEKASTFCKIFTFDSGILLEKRIGYIHDFPVLYLREIGEYGKLEYIQIFKKLKLFAKKNDIDTINSEYLSILYDIPGITERRKLRSDVCLKTNKKINSNEAIGAKVVRGGKFAIFRYCGAYCNIGKAQGNIFGKILSESGIKFSTAYWIIKYAVLPKNISDKTAVADIYVPLI